MMIDNVTSCKCLLQSSSVQYFGSFNFTLSCNAKIKRLQCNVRQFLFSLRIETITKIISTSRTARILIRSRHLGCFLKKDVLKNNAIFTGKHLSRSLSFNKVADIQNISNLVSMFTIKLSTGGRGDWKKN